MATIQAQARSGEVSQAPVAPPRPRRRPPRVGTGLGLGLAVTYLSLIVLIPLAAVMCKELPNWEIASWRSY